MTNWPIWTMAVSSLVFIAAICGVTIVIRVNHASHIYGLWYVFFLTSIIMTIIMIYGDNHGWISWMGGTDAFPVRALDVFVTISSDFIEEMLFLGVLFAIFILPQICSFIVSGMFGCGHPPAYVSTITKFSFLSLLKFLCVFAGIKAASSVLYISLRAEANPYYQSATFIFEATFLLACSFIVSLIYFRIEDLFVVIEKITNRKFIRKTLEHMMRYTDTDFRQVQSVSHEVDLHTKSESQALSNQTIS